ncbi:MAG: nucleoside/nucleotide kinase family protein [Rhodobacteraceae bacterium]|nr:nucleoside/nucleotide kinase family protein [Paracoccaceae bacterium]
MTPEAVALAVRARLPAGAARHFVALAGPPGAGKSTLAERLTAAFGPEAALLPMDGYHLDNAVLDARGTRSRKGAPWTFDTGGLARDLARLRADDGPVLVPVFDRALDLSRGAAREIGPAVRIVVAEGNYLLLDRAPWSELAGFWDVTVALEVPEPVLEARLVARWLGHGHSPDEARARALGNDLPNARMVREESRPADLVVRTG